MAEGLLDVLDAEERRLVLAARVRRQNADLMEAYFGSAQRRVLRRLLMVARRMPETGGGRAIRLTQEDVAALAGTTRPTANRVLRELERDGIVRLGRGSIVVTDVDHLARTVGDRPD